MEYTMTTVPTVRESGQVTRIGRSVLVPYCCRQCGSGTVMAYGYENPRDRICMRCLDEIEVRLGFSIRMSHGKLQHRRLSRYFCIIRLLAQQVSRCRGKKIGSRH